MSCREQSGKNRFVIFFVLQLLSVLEQLYLFFISLHLIQHTRYVLSRKISKLNNNATYTYNSFAWNTHVVKSFET